jgi:AcrR family transcriptional regulator
VPPRSQRRARRRGPGRPAGSDRGEGQEALLRAARELMAEKGLPRVTLREVAERAGVQPALVHYYFAGKRGLLRAVTTAVAGRMALALREAAAAPGGTEERVRRFVRAAVEVFAEEPYAPRLLAEQVLFGEAEAIEEFVEGYARHNLALVRGLLEEGVRRGDLRAVDPMFLVPSILGGCIFFFLAAPVIARLWKIEIGPELARELADHTVDVLLHGISLRPEATA